MSEANSTILAITIALVALAKALSGLIHRSLAGIADLRRTDYEGRALLIRAERGNSEPPTIHLNILSSGNGKRRIKGFRAS